MTAGLVARRGRLEPLLVAARRIQDAADPLGRAARRRLPDATGLSAEGVERALARCFEAHPSDTEIDALCRSVPAAPRAHVVLSANVFVAAHRALALALCASPDVRVRVSRREGVMAALLAEGAPAAFAIVEDLAPEPGDHVWAYGADETLAALSRALPERVVLHGHGSGYGVAVFEPGPGRDATAAASALAEDVTLFDQRGCLSPRVVVVAGDRAAAHAFGEAVAAALAREALAIPPGRAGDDERAALMRWRDTALYAGAVLQAGPGCVALPDAAGPLIVPPGGRSLWLVAAGDPAALLVAHAAAIVAVGVCASAPLEAAMRAALPGARVSPLGRMQQPPFDGPVDLRRAHCVLGARVQRP